MITNFESYTFELNQYEREILLPMVVKQLKFKTWKTKSNNQQRDCYLVARKRL